MIFPHVMELEKRPINHDNVLYKLIYSQIWNSDVETNGVKNKFLADQSIYWKHLYRVIVSPDIP